MFLFGKKYGNFPFFPHVRARMGYKFVVIYVIWKYETIYIINSWIKSWKKLFGKDFLVIYHHLELKKLKLIPIKHEG